MFPYVTRMGEAFSFWNIMVESKPYTKEFITKPKIPFQYPKYLLEMGTISL